MDAISFVYWINGFFEITDLNEGEGILLSNAQVKTIRDHIQLVLSKVTPDRGPVVNPPIKVIPDNGTTPLPYTPYNPWTPYTWPNDGIVYC